jgi:hypothetical protein
MESNFGRPDLSGWQRKLFAGQASFSLKAVLLQKLHLARVSGRGKRGGLPVPFRKVTDIANNLV